MSVDSYAGVDTLSAELDRESALSLSCFYRKQRSSLDVPLPDRTGDEVYLKTVGDILPRLLSDFQPDLVLYDGAPLVLQL